MHTGRLSQRVINAKRLAPSTHGVKDVKRIVPEPGQELGRLSEDIGHVVAVAAYLCDAPCEDHGGIRERVSGCLEGVADSPDKEDPRRDLQKGSREGATEEAKQDVDDLKNCKGLRPFDERADARVDILRTDRRKEDEGAACDPEPEKGRNSVVSNQILVFERTTGLRAFHLGRCR